MTDFCYFCRRFYGGVLLKKRVLEEGGIGKKRGSDENQGANDDEIS